MTFDARGICGNCGCRTVITFTFRTGFECCPGCQASSRQDCARNQRDEEQARRERDAVAESKTKARKPEVRA